MPGAAKSELLSAATMNLPSAVAIDLLSAVEIELLSDVMVITELLSASNSAANCSHD